MLKPGKSPSLPMVRRGPNVGPPTSAVLPMRNLEGWVGKVIGVWLPAWLEERDAVLSEIENALTSADDAEEVDGERPQAPEPPQPSQLVRHRRLQRPVTSRGSTICNLPNSW